MPWKVEQGYGCPPDHPWAVVKSDTGEKVACHATKDGAQRQVAALYAKEPQMHSTAVDDDVERAQMVCNCVSCEVNR